MTPIKVWVPSEEPEPEGLFNPKTCPNAGPLALQNCEDDLDLLVELFALERRKEGKATVHVLDDEGKVHIVDIDVRRELNVYQRERG